MIPKYSNPHLFLNKTTIVSRSALNDSGDEAERDEANPERVQMVARLENILKRSIADVLPASSQSDSHGDGEKLRKRKRRKVESEEQKNTEGGGEEAPVVSFRLLSGTSQPKPISLVPKVAPILLSQGPALEDTEQEAERRASRARAVAVDFAWIMRESSDPRTPLPNSAKKITHVVADLPNAGTPMLVLERPKPPPKPPRVSRLTVNSGVEIQPSPHIHETTCCPIVEAQPSPLGRDKAVKRKRRRGKPREKAVIQPSFWRPTLGMGGKSLGYAWGYAGSDPLQAGKSSRYRRDTMRKGELS